MDDHVTSKPQLNFFEETGGRKGIFKWILSTDHKRIGLLYFYSILSFFLVGVALGLLMRLELLQPGGQYIEAKTYNGVFTLHGVIMIFLFIIPGIPAVFGNLILPIIKSCNNGSKMSLGMKQPSSVKQTFTLKLAPIYTLED